MNGHHLVLGELRDRITGNSLADTHDERYRQKIAALLLDRKGYRKSDIQPRYPLVARAGDKKAIVPVDFIVKVAGRTAMIIQYAPGSLVTRHRSVLAASRLITSYQVPVAVITNGQDADVLWADRGTPMDRGLDGIPDRKRLAAIAAEFDFASISPQRAERESRIFYVYEVDGACPCDDTICRLE